MMEENKQKSARGGRREGAGRKRVEHGRPFTFKTYPEADSVLAQVSGNKTQFVNEAIVAYWRMTHGEE